MTNKRSSKHLRYDILRYLQKKEQTPSLGPSELEDITNALKTSKADIDDQLDILKSQGAIKSISTLKNTFPKLTAIGKTMLEEMEKEN
jgi:predicted transcriptional regulator